MIGNILGADNGTRVCVTSVVDQIIEYSTVDQPLNLRLDGCDLIEEQGLVLWGDATFQLISYCVEKRTDFRERHLCGCHDLPCLQCADVFISMREYFHVAALYEPHGEPQ